MGSMTRWITARTCLAALTWLISLASVAQTLSPGDESSAGLASQVCARCHGVGGDSPSPLVPRLAAQRASYLKAEMLDIRTHERSELLARNVMQRQVADVDEATATALARYYARQPAPPGVPGDPARMARGKALYERGSENRAACATCHGVRAEGFGIFPRLAGQHAVYLQYQLRVKQHDVRRTSVMHGMIGDLGSDDMIDLAAYLASLP
ncbi:c-type cytochrome [Dyella sp. AtDHG13]|uniref:c-type cytochrome n=1 Tax=Dyella sp. AtDHG13 TaxID=1938897 RepID=UPI0009F3A47D|nr:c-type cytochrome [Dyella sp. AtDHG13]